MVDRYSLSTESDALKEAFGIRKMGEYVPTYNAGPTQELPVLLSGQQETIQMMTWGLISKWSNNKAISPKLFNLPVNQAFEKSMYKKGLNENRCAILADGFYLWKQIGKSKRVPYYFYADDRKPFTIAGLWESYEDMDGNLSNTFIMLTISANPQVAPYQEDMPLILSDLLLENWLDELHDMADDPSPFLNQPTAKLKFHSVSPLIANLNQDHEGLIKATLPSDQHGNYTLFS